jgi:sugar (pentulose or hexulose) kinase
VGPEGRRTLDAQALEVPVGEPVVEDVTADRATLRNIPPSVTPARVWRAAVEEVVRHGAGLLATIESVAGPTARLVVTGGWARSAVVGAVKRRVLGPFVEPQVDEAGARGAALTAGIAAGLFDGVEDLPPVRWRETSAPGG